MSLWQLIILGIIIVLNLAILMSLVGALIGASFGSPYVPSGKKIVERMLELAKIKKGEKIFDLGCGDGRIIFEAEKYGAICTGIEISPPVYFYALVRKFITGKKSKIKFGNFFHHNDVHDADVIFMFLLPETVNKFYEEIFPKLKKGARVVSHAFEIKGLKPKFSLLKKNTGHASIYLFIKD